MVAELLEEYFKEFESLTPEIVRANTKNDAFSIVVLKALYGSMLNFNFVKTEVNELANYIIVPPDSSIDIFYQSGDEEDAAFDIIQVKYEKLAEQDIKDCFSNMRDTIMKYIDSPSNVKSKTCRKILEKSDLMADNVNNCNYYVIHSGKTKSYIGLEENQKILNVDDLELLLQNNSKRVKEHILKVYNVSEFDQGLSNSHGIVCNLNCFDLAELNNTYYRTRIGRNILYGMNLRESLANKNKAFDGMKNTIKNHPENFWYYNNGITIIAESIKDLKNNKYKLSNFSIVNGAQTSSSLGMILDNNNDTKIMENLKKAFVLTRILVVTDEKIQKSIAIFNNTQNPITSRDLVSNNEEQDILHNRLLNKEYPEIYMEIRRGNETPDQLKRKYKHRFTTNEELAQLAYAGFYLKPFYAKDKKATLFAKDFSQTEYTINKFYDDIFNYDKEEPEKNGILFRKSKTEIDELLFVRYLYNLGKNYLRKGFQEDLDKDKDDLSHTTDTIEKENIQERLSQHSALKETVGICGFYYISAYYELLANSITNKKRYDYDKFYNDKLYRDNFIEEFSDFLLMLTIEVLVDTALESGNSSNINTWIRKAECQDKFLKFLRHKIDYDKSVKKQFGKLIEKYKCI